MHLGCAACALVIALAACGSSSAASHSSPSGAATSTTRASTNATSNPTSAAVCGPSGAKALHVDREARVYESGGTIFGCAQATRRSFRLGSAASCMRSPRAVPVVLAGTTAAYGLERCGVDNGSAVVVVRRLTDGRQLRTLEATTKGVPPESYRSVTAIVAKPGGAVAWIAARRSIIRHSVDIEVHRADAAGKTLLDSGAAIELTSLHLHGSGLTWRHGSTTRFATLR